MEQQTLNLVIDDERQALAELGIAIRRRLRLKRLAVKTCEAYRHWMRRFVVFHDMRHPAELGEEDVELWLDHLARHERVAASTQNQALQAVNFLYTQVLDQPLDAERIDPLRGRRRRTLPNILAPSEVSALMAQMQGQPLLMARLIYGSGLRHRELRSLRIKDVDCERGVLMVRDGKGGSDRQTLLPRSLVPDLQLHLAHRHETFVADLARGAGHVPLPHAMDRKNPSAVSDWGWQFVFASQRISPHRQSGIPCRFHCSEGTLRKALTEARRLAGIVKQVGAHTLRHCFATHLLEQGTDMRRIQLLMGHRDIRTTMRYLHVARQLTDGVVSPMDALCVAATGGVNNHVHGENGGQNNWHLAGQLLPLPR